LRVQANNNQTVLNDLREFISLDYKIDNKYATRSLKDFSVDFTKLINYLENKSIEKIFYWKDDELDIPLWNSFKEKFKLESLNL